MALGGWWIHACRAGEQGMRPGSSAQRMPCETAPSADLGGRSRICACRAGEQGMRPGSSVQRMLCETAPSADLGRRSRFWALLGPLGFFWARLGPVGPFWAFLGRVGPFGPFRVFLGFLLETFGKCALLASTPLDSPRYSLKHFLMWDN